MPLHLPAFDPSRAFVAKKLVFRFNGMIYKRGDPFPHETAEMMPDERKMEKLYKGHFIRYADDTTPLVRPAHPLSPRERQRQERISDRSRGNLDAEAKAREDKIAKLEKDNSRAALLKLADGIELPAKATKLVIATAIVDAGRGGGDGAP